MDSLSLFVAKVAHCICLLAVMGNRTRLSSFPVNTDAHRDEHSLHDWQRIRFTEFSDRMKALLAAKVSQLTAVSLVSRDSAKPGKKTL